MQGYIDNEINMNGEQNCDGTCSDYKSTKNHECQNGTLCAHTNFASTRCTGDMFNCNTIDSDGIACLVVGSVEFNLKCHRRLRDAFISIHSLFVSAFFYFECIFHLFLTRCRKMNGKIDATIM